MTIRNMAASSAKFGLLLLTLHQTPASAQGELSKLIAAIRVEEAKYKDLDVAYDREKLSGDASREVEYVGKNEWKEEPCEVVRVQDGAVCHEVWLAERRNRLPCRNLEFRGANDSLPRAESSVQNWQEVEPGMRFPMETQTLLFDRPAVDQGGKQKIRWQLRVKIESVAVGVDHPDQFFSRPSDGE